MAWRQWKSVTPLNLRRGVSVRAGPICRSSVAELGGVYVFKCRRSDYHLTELSSLWSGVPGLPEPANLLHL
jgi:hypothetical protein